MKKILIVDDSALMRRVLSDIINKDDEIHTQHSAADGLEALELLQRESFDAIVLDLIMPRMNGIAFLQECNRQGRHEKVLIVSTIARHGARETIQALELGAFDFVTKPGNLRDAKSREFAVKLIHCLYVALDLPWSPEKVRFLEQNLGVAQGLQDIRHIFPGEAQRAAAGADRGKTRRAAMAHSGAEPVRGAKKLVAIACSTGGPKALQRVIPLLPPDLDAAVLLVQHMPVGFTASLSSRLDELSQIHVKEAADGEVIRKGTVYIARGGSQMRIVEKNRQEFVLSVREEEARNGLRPCADIMYESLQGSSFDDITCVVLTGMGADGTGGILKLEETNKIYVIAQDAESCTVYGMPKAIAQSGAVDEVCSLDQIAEAIRKHVGVR